MHDEARHAEDARCVADGQVSRSAGGREARHVVRFKALHHRMHVQVPTRRVSSQQTIVWHLNMLLRTEIPGAHGTLIPFAQKPIKDVTRADVEAIRTARRATPGAATHRKGGEVGVNRLLERCRHLFSWAVVEGFIEQTPFLKGGIALVKLTKEQPRSRRLVGDGEEDRLLHAAGPHLRDLILAALSTGARLTELLSLRWRDLRSGPSRAMLIFRAEHTKTNVQRAIPVGAKLAAVLEMRRHAPDGVPFPPDAYIFGNAVEEKIGSIKKGWMTTVLRAAGHTPQWEKGGKNQLNAVSRAAYAEVGLHFHDLRREAASRMLESGSTLVEVQKFLAHTSVAQTATYLESSAKALETAIDRKEAHEQRLDEARREVLPGGKTSPTPVVSLGPDRVQ